MDSGIILIVVLIIIGFAITWSNQSQLKEVEDRQTQYTRERQAMAEHDNKSALLLMGYLYLLFPLSVFHYQSSLRQIKT